jgi:hypothetical protein
LLLCWQTNKSSSFCSLSAAVNAGGMLSVFVLTFIISNAIWLQFRADNYKIPAQQQALPLPASVKRYRTKIELTDLTK